MPKIILFIIFDVNLLEMQFGDKIQVTHILRRDQSYGPHPKATYPRSVYFKTWRPIPQSQGTGIVIGKRTLFNGYNVYEPDCGNIFHPLEHFDAYLVALDMKRNPVYVKIEE